MASNTENPPSAKSETKKEGKEDTKREDTFFTQTEVLLSVETKLELQNKLKRSRPRKVCALLGNGVAIYCDRNCQHGDYDSQGEAVEAVERDDENVLMFSPYTSVTRCFPYGGEVDNKKKELHLNKMDGSPLNLMMTLPSGSNKIYRYQASGPHSDTTVRRDRPTCGYCRF